MKRNVVISILCLITLGAFAQSTNTYEYDNLNRLTKVTYANGAEVQYTYDAVGNRLTKTMSGANTQCGITATANPVFGGTVVGAGSFSMGSYCTLSAMPNTGFVFVNWTKNGTQVSTNATYSFAVTENADYVANFTMEYYSITATASPAEGGTVVGSGDFVYGEPCTLTATANEGYSFVNWTKDGMVVSTNASYNFMVTETANYVANFTLNNYEVTVAADPADGALVWGDGMYQYGSIATVIAFSNENYYFEYWTMNGAFVSTASQYSFEVTENCQLVAHLYFFDDVEENTDSPLSIYPNPTREKLIISGDGIQTVKLFDETGKLILANEYDGAENVEINMSSLGLGVYLISVRMKNGETINKSVVKK